MRTRISRALAIAESATARNSAMLSPEPILFLRNLTRSSDPSSSVIPTRWLRLYNTGGTPSNE